MTLQTELDRVREYLTGANPPPTNEANTCDWVIAPLLRQCGYHYHDIHAQGHDAAGGIPDYTILPNTPYTWFLEAKKWQASIKDTHVIQAINYAHAHSSRWVVLTNGYEWRLYDDHIVGVGLADRLVVVARLDCGTEVENLLGALSKASVLSGGLEQYALTTRLNALLQQELAAANSDVIKAITKVCKGKSGLSAITPADVAAYFHTRGGDDPPVPPPIPPVDVSDTSPANGLTLPELLAAGNAVQGRQPVLLIFPDGNTKAISTWRDMTLGIVEWLFTQGKSPALPFRGQNGGKRCFINTMPEHPNGTRMMHKRLDVNGQTLYISVNRSVPEFLRCLMVLCDEVGEPSTAFRVAME